MEFDKTRCYSALNADELRAGDKVIVADQLSVLKQRVREGKEDSAIVLQRINGEDWGRRFGFTMSDYALAYLVERKENCTNCHYAYLKDEGVECALTDEPKPTLLYEDAKLNRCRAWGKRAEPKTENNCTNCSHSCKSINPCLRYEPKTEQKAEKHYRPFRDTDELIKVFCEKTPKIYDKDDEKLFMPYIWVRNKENKRVWLITEFDNRLLDYLFTNCEFLDSSVCGVEE